ncbi:sirohydrochlorin cobaltochelatase [Motilibacter rhizosphaerae]|uniref:Sirohydrochlorin cobaltochelatase n=1 Tax=Motilibacter rhizosphaerae TaxID=598652 RepID=A0A4Q7NRX8_9ACTN|nr:sirohydrochlorin chelatase [Motilibacter rhizosphaerae]RZS89837.1 sirohydrochlorin cobaltochelatase [Motilibacter rhizosphaerae]
MTRPPLFVVGHGTRSAEGVAQFQALIERTGRLLAPRGIPVRGGFIELSPPPVRDVVAELVGAGHRHLVAVPLVLVAAGHGKGDIPGAMQREQDRHAGLTYAYGRPLGPHPVLQDVLETRIAAVAGDLPREDTAVVLVGRGSTDPDGNAEIAKVARLLWEGRGYAFVEPAFISLARPSVPEGIERARRLGAKHIVVAPYFLFAGVLPDRIVEQTQAYAAEHPDLDVRVAGLLGDCDELAGLVAERYEEALRGDIRMNCDTCIYRIAMPGHEHRVGAAQAPHDHPDDSTHSHGHEHPHAHAHG